MTMTTIGEAMTEAARRGGGTGGGHGAYAGRDGDPEALRARAAERGMSVSDYVREEQRRAEREAVWARALAELENHCAHHTA